MEMLPSHKLRSLVPELRVHTDRMRHERLTESKWTALLC